MLLAAVTVLAVATGLAACSSSAPRIMQIDHRIVAAYHPGAAAVSEVLRVSVDVYDADGEGELDRLTVRLPGREIEWVLPVAQLTSTTQEGQHWYRTDALGVSGLARIPRGAVEVVATDLSGREDRRTVQLPLTLPDLDVGDMPRLDREARLTVPGEVTSVVLAFGTSTGPEFRRVAVDGGEVDLRGTVDDSLIARITAEGREPRVWILGEWSPVLWIESGPWPLPTAMRSPSAAEEP